MPVRVAVGDPKSIAVDFPGTATGDVEVSVVSERSGATSGPFVASDEGSGTYSYMLTAAMVDAVDELSIEFSGTVAGTDYLRKEQVEVAGAYYFTVGEARTLGPIASEFTDAQIESMRTSVEDQIESNCDTFFVPRFVEEKVNGNGDSFIRLTENYIHDIISVTQDGTDITASVELDGRYLWNSSTWTPGHRNIVVQYESGYDSFPPEDLRRKAIEAARYGLLRETRQGMPSQVIQMTTDVGVLKMAAAGLKQPFGLPEVDAVVLAWARRVGVPVAGV